MGVAYYSCVKCNRGFRDDSEAAIFCEKCHNHFCSKKCAKPVMKVIENEDDPYESCFECCICRKEFCNDYILVNFLLKYFKLTRKEAEKLYRKEDK